MATQVNIPRIVRFGAFEANLVSGELRKSGVRIKLQDRPFQILAILLEQPGEMVTREELQRRLWPADTFVDFEHGLNTAITKLRQALADDADNPRFIETLPRRGYRFLAPVTTGGNGSGAGDGAAIALPAGEASATVSPTQAIGDGHVRRSTLYWAAAVVFLLGLGTATWFFRTRPAAPASFAAIRITPLNGLPKESDAAFSPDGGEVAFVWAGPEAASAPAVGRWVHIYVSHVGAEAPRRLTNSPWAELAPVWSPEGRYIAFMRFTPGERDSGIYVASAQGFSERKVQAVEPRNVSKELDWSPDGKYLTFAERESPDKPFAVYLLSLDTLEKRPVTLPPAGTLGDFCPEFSPDGKWIAFLRDRLDTQEIYVMPSGGGTPRQVTFDNRIVQGVSWSASGRDLIFSSNRGGTPSLWRIPVQGGTAERLPTGGGMAVRPTVARRGNRMAYTNVNYVSEIWRAELPARGQQPAAPQKFIASTALEEGPQYSPDGKRIAFQSTRTGDYEIWRCDADGSNLVQLTHFGGPLTGTPRWSPDGRELVFDSRPAGHSHVFAVHAEGGQPRQVTSGDSENGVASWSVDGKWIYFASSRGGVWEIWKTPAAGGTPVQLTRHGGFAPQPSRDGKFVFYAKGRDLPGLWKVPVDGGEEVQITTGPPATGWAYFMPAEKGVYYADGREHHAGIFFYDFQTQQSSLLRSFGTSEPFGSEGAPGLSISPDGRYALYTALGQTSINVMLVENFRY